MPAALCPGCTVMQPLVMGLLSQELVPSPVIPSARHRCNGARNANLPLWTQERAVQSGICCMPHALARNLWRHQDSIWRPLQAPLLCADAEYALQLQWRRAAPGGHHTALGAPADIYLID